MLTMHTLATCTAIFFVPQRIYEHVFPVEIHEYFLLIVFIESERESQINNNIT